jgi:trimethylamine-N-oxide reductase (cytochrome c)
MDEWKKQYPEAFEREYDPAVGLVFDAWIED